VEEDPSRAGVVRLHIEAPEPGIRLDGATICAAPCDREIDGRGRARFFFRAPNAPLSERFEVTGMVGPLTARVSAGSTPLRSAGFVLLGVGLYGLWSAVESVVVGSILLGALHAPRDAEPWFVSGAVAAGAGAGLTSLGAWLAARGRTTFELGPALPPPSR
jgi:hypothetical protein